MKAPETKKLSHDEVQERIKKGLCFKCADKWIRWHKYKSSQAFVRIEDETIEDETEQEELESESSHENEEDDEAKPSDSQEEVELSLNALTKVSRPFSKRLMAWIGKFEATLLGIADLPTISSIQL